MTDIILKKRKEDRILFGHPWIFQGEVAKVEGNFSDGDSVNVKDSKGNFVGQGFINGKSQILVRIISREKEKIDKVFFHKRIKTAIDYRKPFSTDTSAQRIIFSEADFLPGLIVDLYNSSAVIQTLTLGMDQRKAMIVGILNELLHPTVIFERNDAPVREKEGLPRQKGILSGSLGEKEICTVDGIKYYVDIAEGHKTGIYLDQRENYLKLAKIVSGKTVLDCFSYTGGFSLHSAMYGAKNVLGIDVSGSAIESAKKNAELNKVTGQCSWQAADVFTLLGDKAKQKDLHDIVILDPPSFTRSKNAIEPALRGYKEINLKAMKIINTGGFLLTFSCSHHINKELFLDVILSAASDAKRTIRLTDYCSQSKDHPIIPAIPETEYLKGFVLQIV